MTFLHPFINPFNLSASQIGFWIVICVIVIPAAAWLTAKILKGR